MTETITLSEKMDEMVNEVRQRSFNHSHKHDVNCVGCDLYENSHDCNYLDGDVCNQCPCLECIIKPICKEACEKFDAGFWGIIDEQLEERRRKNQYENKTL